MARSLRLLIAGGWYHVVNRGNRQGALFRSDDDRRRFLGRLAELPERFRVEIHAFVLMDNHYHLLVRTLDANLNHAIRWLQVSYSASFNWAHQIHGHVFQGRYKSVLIQEGPGLAEVARYIHLNPVRIDGLGLGKAEQRRARVADIDDPGAALVSRRLETLDSHAWSSWRVYGGAEPSPGWLETREIGGACGGRTRKEQRAALRRYTEAPVRQGHIDRPWDLLVAGLVLGDASYAKAMLGTLSGGGDHEQGERTRPLKGISRVSWSEIVTAAEAESGRKWASILEAHGDWVRDGTLYVAVRHLGHRLAEVYRHVPGLKYPAAAQALRRFKESLGNDSSRQHFVTRLRRTLARD